MTAGDFDRLENESRPLYGPRKIVVCGYPKNSHYRFMDLLEISRIRDTDLVFATSGDKSMTLEMIISKPHNSGCEIESDLPPAIIVAGITEKELHRLMDRHRKLELQRPLWATLTPTSEKWLLGKLLEHLENERQAFLETQNDG